MMNINSMHNTQATSKHSRLAAFWAVLGALGTLAGFPYLLALNPSSTVSPPLPLPILAIASATQTGVLLFILSWIGLRLGQALRLDTPFARAFVYRLKPPTLSKRAINFALTSGILGGFIILGLVFVFQPFMPQTAQSTTLNIALWKRVLACFYGGITEELLLRLFLMTLIAWVFWKMGLRGEKQPSPLAFWLAIALSALLFGVAHLPAAATLWSLTPIVIIRTLVLNSLIGIAFGFLYWQWGLEYAMLSHFCADIVLHIIGGS
jgi:membrane protease YdiL (CAAX protease family)